MIQTYWKKLTNDFDFTPVSNNAYESFSMNGMDFHVTGGDAKGMGHMSLIHASGMNGAFQMDSLIINPFEVDAPLINIDRVITGQGILLMMAQYDTLVSAKREEEAFEAIKKEFSYLPDAPSKEHWYDDLEYKSTMSKMMGVDQKSLSDEIINDYMKAYLEVLQSAKTCNPEQKKIKADTYRDGLLSQGGPATDGFLQAWGKEKTADLFKNVVFG